jgi:ergothioneine biosynthesis protein EgtB
MGAAPSPLAERYRRVRDATRHLAAPLAPEDQLVQSMPDASPTKWHLAHTTWFFETFVLERFARGYRPVDERYQFLFNSYYESLGARQPRPQRGAITRPSLDEVGAYRERVDESMAALLDERAAGDLAFRTELGLQHEQQHQELILTDIHHALWRNPLRPAYLDAPETRAARATTAEGGWIEHPGGLAEIGHAGGGFAFDNEVPRHRVHLEPFAIARRAVTSGEYLAFVEAGGYRQPDLWLSEGWATVVAEGWEAPLYWERDGSRWREFTLRGMRPLDLEAPVAHVSYYEADAYARWAGARLPTEAEWEVAATRVAIEGNFVESGRLAPAPAAACDGGPAQMFGDVWEWTASAYLPYPRFRPFPAELGEYNGKFMVNQMVLRGGSCLTPASHVRATYRNFFPPAARWQMSGLRLARWLD